MDEIQIANSALSLLGDRRITSLSDGSDLAAKVSLRFSAVRDAVNEIHPWNWAMVRKELAPDAETPDFDYDYQYALPTKPYCLKVRDTNDEGSGWEVGLNVNGQRVLLSDNDSMKIRYTARVEDLNIWSPLAVLAFTYLLAADLAVAITGQLNKAEAHRKAFEAAIVQAQISDSREGSPVVVKAPTTLTGIR